MQELYNQLAPQRNEPLYMFLSIKPGGFGVKRRRGAGVRTVVYSSVFVSKGFRELMLRLRGALHL